MTTSPVLVTTNTADTADTGDTNANTVDTTATDLPPEPALRILKIATCDSLSGRSTLTYHIGILEASSDNDSQDIQLRLFHNTAKGYFCKDWVSVIDLLLMEAKSFSSGDVQRRCFEGKSVNSGGFVLAALRNEGLIRGLTGSLRSYERVASSAWQEEIAALIEAGVSLSELQLPDAAPVAAKKGKASFVATLATTISAAVQALTICQAAWAMTP